MAQDTYSDDTQADPTASYGDPAVDPETLPVASHPDPKQDPYLSDEAARPIATGSLQDAVENPEVLSPELEDESNLRIHGRHHHRHGGRPLESIAQPTELEKQRLAEQE